MTVQYMQNSIIRIFGFESDVSIMFFDYCKIHTKKEISSFYTMCLAIPVFEDEEED